MLNYSIFAYTKFLPFIMFSSCHRIFFQFCHHLKFFSHYLPIISNLISWPNYFLPGYLRGRSNSLRVDDILLRRSNSLRFGLEATRRISSVEELGMAPSSSIFGPNPPGATPSVERRSSIKLPLNGSIGLEVRVWYPGTLLKYNDLANTSCALTSLLYDGYNMDFSFVALFMTPHLFDVNYCPSLLIRLYGCRLPLPKSQAPKHQYLPFSCRAPLSDLMRIALPKPTPVCSRVVFSLHRS